MEEQSQPQENFNHSSQQPKSKKLIIIVAAVAVLLIIGIGSLYYRNGQKPTVQQQTLPSKELNEVNTQHTDSLWTRYSEANSRVTDKSVASKLGIFDLKNFVHDDLYLENYTGIVLRGQTKDGFLLSAHYGGGRDTVNDINLPGYWDILEFNLLEKEITLLALSSKNPRFPSFIDKQREFFFYCNEDAGRASSTYHLFNFANQQDAVVVGTVPICGVGRFYSQNSEAIFLSYCGGGRGGFSCDYGEVNIATMKFRHLLQPPAEPALQEQDETSNIPLPQYIIDYVGGKNFYIKDREVYKNLDNGTPYQVGKIYYSPQINGAVAAIQRKINFVSPNGSIKNIVNDISPGAQRDLVGNYFIYTF